MFQSISGWKWPTILPPHADLTGGALKDPFKYAVAVEFVEELSKVKPSEWIEKINQCRGLTRRQSIRR
jgi:hypothetical protein